MNWSRRDVLKGLGGVPVLGALWWAGATQITGKAQERQTILNTLKIQPGLPPQVPGIGDRPVRVGIIGFGGRGEHLCRAMGYATEDWFKEVEEERLENPQITAIEDFKNQEKLNVELAAICEVFDVRAERAMRSFNKEGKSIKRFRNYLELLDSGEVEAVVIATPDHWHAPMSIAALERGLHVYVEKPMTHTLAETYALKKAAEESKAVFAVGHQHRQTLSFRTAQNIVEQGVLGHINLIQTNTNRNDDNGAWTYDIHEEASPETIDWKEFLGNAPQVPFNKKHFFRWRKWWAYGSGLSGDLLTHDYDRLNCVLNMGIPKTVSSSGGIYTHRDGRTVPDVLQVNMEFPDYFRGGNQAEGKEKGMTFCYSATLGNGFSRPTILMGHDATMELGNALTVWPDAGSSRYRQMLEEGKMMPFEPIYQYNPAAQVPDAISSATSQYFADKGLLWTYIDGKRVDSTFLHIREWLSAIRNGGPVSCGIKEGFEEAITAHMAGLSWKLGQAIQWDAASERIVGFDDLGELDRILLSDRLQDGEWA